MQKCFKLILGIVTILLMFSSVSYADSLRLNSGRLLQDGDSKLDVINALGAPDFKDEESIGISGDGYTVESWYYDYSGKNIIIKISGGVIVSISIKQKGRL